MRAQIVETKSGRLSRRDRILFVILAALAVAWLATLPLRTRLSRETARIEQETAHGTQALNTAQQLKAQEQEARARLTVAPQDFAAHMSLASALGQQRKYAEELANLRAAEQIDPRSAAPHAAMRQLYNASKLDDLAIVELKKAIALAPNDDPSLNMLAYKYVALGWNMDATALLTRALERQPNDPRLHVSLALVYFQTGQMAGAEQHLLTAQRLAPKDMTVIGPLIEVYRKAQRFKDALEAIAAALPVLPDKQILLQERAQIYQQMGRPDDAINTANQLIELWPGNMQALYVRALANKMKGYTAAAMRDFEQVHATAPNTEETRLLLGQLYMQQGQVDRGKALLAEYRRNRDVGEQLGRLTMRVASQSNDWRSHLEIGNYYYRGGGYTRAIVELKRALELKPGEKDATRLLAASLRAVHRNQEADTL